MNEQENKKNTSPACAILPEQLSCLLDGEVTPEEEAALRQHLAGCAACRAEYDRLSRLQRLIGDCGVAVPPFVRQNVLTAIRREQRQNRLRHLTAAFAAAAAVCVLAVGVVHFLPLFNRVAKDEQMPQDQASDTFFFGLTEQMTENLIQNISPEDDDFLPPRVTTPLPATEAASSPSPNESMPDAVTSDGEADLTDLPGETCSSGAGLYLFEYEGQFYEWNTALAEKLLPPEALTEFARQVAEQAAAAGDTETYLAAQRVLQES